MNDLQRYAVIGSPIAHSLSPRMQQAAFDALSIHASYEAIDAATAEPVFQRLRDEHFSGWNVTTPLKEQAIDYVDRTSAAARSADAVNVVRRDGKSLVGHNTDGEGFVRAVVELWPESLSGSVLILGSGPAARAIALALRACGVTRLWCWSRNAAKAQLIAPPPRGGPNFVVFALPPGADVPADVMRLAGAAEMAFDLNYSPGASPLDQVHISKRSNGLPFLLHQGILSFEWWTGVAAPVAAMRAALKKRPPP